MRTRPKTWDVSLLRRGHQCLGHGLSWALCVVAAWIGAPVLAIAAPTAPPSQTPVATQQPAAETLLHIRAYAEAGAIDLALASINAGQPAYTRHPRTWLAWESLRFSLLAQARLWQPLTAAVAHLPPGLADAARTGFETAGVKAWLAMHQGQPALHLLRHLLWSTANAPDPASVHRWRRLLIEAYLEANQTEDARLALLQYQADYTIKGARERAVMARVWLRVNEPADALALLKSDRQGAAAWLYWLAVLRAGVQPAVTVQHQAERAAQAKGTPPGEAARLWGVAATAALQRHDLAAAVADLEAFVSGVPRIPLNTLLPYDGDTLWATYRRLGEQLGNRDRRLLGDDKAWEQAADQAGKSGHAIEARTDNATLALTGQTAAGRMVGYRWLLTALLARPDGTRLVDRLFLTAPKTFPHLSALPVPVRLVLANDAVDRHDLPLAARLMVGVSEVPPGENAFDWGLRVARVLILGGQPQRGAARLKALMAQSHRLDPAQADRLMQVLFNLQSLKHNGEAITLFQALLPHLTDPQLRREVLFWEADSFKAMGHDRQSARLYLQSALQNGKPAFDQWGQTARFNASQALAKAGMTADARRLLSRLLAQTKAPERVAFLKQKLAELGRADGAAVLQGESSH